MHYYANLFW